MKIKELFSFFGPENKTIPFNTYLNKKAWHFCLWMLVIVNAMGLFFLNVKVEHVQKNAQAALEQKSQKIKMRLHGDLDILNESDFIKLIPDLKELFAVSNIVLSKDKPPCSNESSFSQVEVCSLQEIQHANAEAKWIKVSKIVPLELSFDAWFLITLSVTFLLFVVASIFALKKGLEKQLSVPIREIEQDPENWSVEKYQEGNLTSIKEIENLGENMKHSIRQARESQSRLEKINKENELYKFTRVLAHDIKAPIATLKMLHQTKNIDETERHLLSSVIHKVNRIAEEIIRTGSGDARKNPVDEKITKVMISPLINGFVEEELRRFESKENFSIKAFIDSKLEQSFIKVRPIELRRILSNLVQNSVEAQEKSKGSCRIKIKVTNGNPKGQIKISVIDNGPGVKKENLGKIFESGYSVGTKGSSGLGLFSVKNIVENYGGKIEAKNEMLGDMQIGFRVKMTFKKATAPFWFVDKIILSQSSVPVILDDDSLIHGCWDQVLKPMGITPVHFSRGEDFSRWYLDLPDSKKQSILLLSDYELLGEQENGIEIIRRLKLETQSIVVSGRFDELIEDYKLIKGLKLIPKTCVSDVIIVSQNQSEMDFEKNKNPSLISKQI